MRCWLATCVHYYGRGESWGEERTERIAVCAHHLSDVYDACRDYYNRPQNGLKDVIAVELVAEVVVIGRGA